MKESKNSTLKKAKWKLAKVDWLKKVPKRYKIEVEGLDDNSEYYHPLIKLSENVSIRGQGDIKNDGIYGESVTLNKKLALGGLLHGIRLDLHAELFEYLVNNFEEIKGKIEESFNQIEKLHHLREDLRITQDNIMYNSIQEHIDNYKLNDSIGRLYKVSEYLENERLNG